MVYKLQVQHYFVKKINSNMPIFIFTDCILFKNILFAVESLNVQVAWGVVWCFVLFVCLFVCFVFPYICDTAYQMGELCWWSQFFSFSFDVSELFLSFKMKSHLSKLINAFKILQLTRIKTLAVLFIIFWMSSPISKKGHIRKAFPPFDGLHHT